MASAAQATATSTSQTTPNREIDKPLGGEQTTNGNSVAEEVAPPAPSPETTSPATTAPVAQAEETQKSPSARAPTLTPVIPPAPVLIAPGPAPASRRKSKSKTPIQDASNSMRIHVDGRVKNPIPSRIQHIAKKDSGNFSVMHIGVSGTLSEDPDAAARRTSQRTEAQARQASQGGWQPPKRSRAAWHTDEPVTLLTSQALASTPRSRQQPPSTGPAPQEAKSEQARLLTLLRTLHPMLVVDQLCKALAYFGGIPGAPPPTDGSFPPSATKNGSGALLVGWLSEIFPHVENPPLLAPPLQIPSRASATSAAPAPDASRWSDATPSGATPSKRPRGRPKGSKSSKARKDKGIKKSHPVAAQGADDSQPTMGGDGDGIDGATSTPAVAATESFQSAGAPLSTPVSNAPASSLNLDSSATNTPGGKKRGRPKGSKNRPKAKPDAPRGLLDQHATESPATIHQVPKPTMSTSSAGQNATTLPGAGPVMPPTPVSVAGESAASLPSPSSNRTAPSLAPSSQGQGQSNVQSTQLAALPGLAPRAGPAATKKRAADSDGQGSVEGTTQQGGTAAKPQKAPKAKRRRVTKESEPEHATGAAQAPGPDRTASQAVPQSFASGSPSQPASSSFDSHDSVNDNRSTSTTTISRDAQQQQRHQHHVQAPAQQQHQQAQHQRFSSQQQPHASPPSVTADRRSAPAVQTCSSPQRRDATAAGYGLQPRSGMSPQMLYAQQQRQQDMLHQQQQQQPQTQKPQTTGPRDTGANMPPTKAMAGHPPQYRQNLAVAQAAFGAGVATVPRQRSMAAGRDQRQQAPHQVAARQPRGAMNQNRPQLPQQVSEMGSFATYNEQSFLNMDYGLTERDLQDAEAVMGRHDG